MILEIFSISTKFHWRNALHIVANLSLIYWIQIMIQFQIQLTITMPIQAEIKWFVLKFWKKLKKRFWKNEYLNITILEYALFQSNEMIHFKQQVPPLIGQQQQHFSTKFTNKDRKWHNSTIFNKNFKFSKIWQNKPVSCQMWLMTINPCSFFHNEMIMNFTFFPVF